MFLDLPSTSTRSFSRTNGPPACSQASFSMCRTGFSSTCFSGGRRHQAECAASLTLQRLVLRQPRARPCS